MYADFFRNVSLLRISTHQHHGWQVAPRLIASPSSCCKVGTAPRCINGAKRRWFLLLLLFVPLASVQLWSGRSLVAQGPVAGWLSEAGHLPTGLAPVHRARRSAPPDSRWLFITVDAQATATTVNGAAKHYIPDVHMPWDVCQVVLPQWSHLLLHQDWRVHPLQLRVCRWIYGATMRVQGPRRNIFAHKAASADRDSEHRRWRHSGSHTCLHSLRHGILVLSA